MRSSAALAAVFALTIGLSACGKYGPPVRSLPQQPPPIPEAAETQPQVPEEEIPEPGDFDDAQSNQESSP